ncbi:biosynthetic peptidoglycan transglycosylase, partial [uncultured Pseudophaeobacter sp.]|uniref:transglycosylase domain-containing protein n=1 Tax=uncultured Pseudophaeobacter sp. TaxID=1759421 RepID=UPI0025FE623B
MLRFILSFFGSIFSTVTLGIAMVALTLGAIFWIYGRDLPSHESLSQYQPPTISRIYSGEGRMIDEFAKERRLFTPSAEIPDLVKQAFISAEDKNFYSHNGYDARGIAAAAVEAVRSRGDNVRGASTITQQVVKNVFLWQGRSWVRKGLEAGLTPLVEVLWPKRRILEVYLNVAETGEGLFGVGAAARRRFGTTAAELSPVQAARLAVTLPN